MKFLIWSTDFCSAETGTFDKADKKSLESLKKCTVEDGEEHLDQSCVKRKIMTQSQGKKGT